MHWLRKSVKNMQVKNMQGRGAWGPSLGTTRIINIQVYPKELNTYVYLQKQLGYDNNWLQPLLTLMKKIPDGDVKAVKHHKITNI